MSALAIFSKIVPDISGDPPIPAVSRSITGSTSILSSSAISLTAFLSAFSIKPLLEVLGRSDCHE